jgi:putative transposase
MARIARLVIPGVPHHVTQRGDRRKTIFFEDAEYRLYRHLLGAAARRAGAAVWAYCLMPDHVHAIVTPCDEDGLRRTFADLHRRYTGRINGRNGWTGRLWQGRFSSVAMDDHYLINAVRYVSLNPVRARLVERAEDWPWSSVRTHLAGQDDGVVTVAPVLNRVGDFAAFIAGPFDEETSFSALRRAETTGRPVGGQDWIEGLERRLNRALSPARRGPKPKPKSDGGANAGGEAF